MGQKDQVEAIPAGSLPFGADTSDAGAKAQTDTAADAQTGDQPILGKYKTQEDLIKAHQELESRLGSQGSELGDLRKQSEFLMQQNQALMDKLGTTSKSDKKNDAAAPDFNAQIKDLADKVESGDLDIASALKQQAALTVDKMGQVLDQKLIAAKTQSEADKIRDKFLGEHPDFAEMQKSGRLAQIRAANPIHDDLTAYFEIKRQEAVADVDTKIKTAMEQGRIEGAKLAQGAEAAGRVQGKNGASPARSATTIQNPRNEGELLQGMMAHLQQSRGS
jgi:hypothetical protein